MKKKEKETEPAAEAAAEETGGGEEPAAEVEPVEPPSEAEENHQKYLRAIAELENTRKRAVREQQRAAQLALAALVRGLLPALDSFERALEAAEGAHDFQTLADGVRMAEQQIYRTLNDNKIEEIAALHQPFDPTCHEGVTQEPSDEHPEGTVVRVFERGFRIGEIVVRAAKVALAAPALDEPSSQPEREEPDEQGDV